MMADGHGQCIGSVVVPDGLAQGRELHHLVHPAHVQVQAVRAGRLPAHAEVPAPDGDGTAAALGPGRNIEACVVRIQRDRSVGWNFVAAEPPAVQSQPEGDDETEHTHTGVLRAVLDRYKMLAVHNITDREKRVSEMQRAVEEATLMEMPLLEKNLVAISTIASISTMVGLLGTTLGMMIANVPAVFLGDRITRLIPLRIMRIAAAAIFGFYFINRNVRNIAEMGEGTFWRVTVSFLVGALCSAIAGNRLRATAIDNWSQFGGPARGFFANVSRYLTEDIAISVLARCFRAVRYEALGTHNILNEYCLKPLLKE